MGWEPEKFDWTPYGGYQPSKDELNDIRRMFDKEIDLASTASMHKSAPSHQKWRRWRAACEELVPGSYNTINTTHVLAALVRQGYTPDELRAMFALTFT